MSRTGRCSKFGGAGGHTRASWDFNVATYGDMTAAPQVETGLKFTLPGTADPIAITKIDYNVRYPKTIFEDAGQLHQVQDYARPYIAAEWEARPLAPGSPDDTIQVRLPVKTMAGKDAVLVIEVPRKAPPAGSTALPDMSTWLPHESKLVPGAPLR
jgi:hypothetical protein